MAIYDLCPACCNAESTELQAGIRECQACGAVFGQTDPETSYQIVEPEWADDVNLPVSQWRYFDFLCTKPDGSQFRRHGWYDPQSRKLLQVG